VTTSGYRVLDAAGQPIRAAGGEVKVGADGAVSVGGRPAGTLAIVSLTDPKKVGDTLFTGQRGAAPAGTRVHQGFLEASNLDPARTMVDMISSLRAFESAQRVIHSIDETLGRGISAGSVTGG
jgi:flagellar basal-body rod protein FlgG